MRHFSLVVLYMTMAGCAVFSGREIAPVRDMTLLPPPVLMDGIGNSRFPVTTRSREAQAYFNQGVSLVHGYWYFEAWRAFREAARLDSSCAMAYWGIYQSRTGNNKNRKEKSSALKRAKALASNAGERERYYIGAIALLDSLGGREGRLAFIDKMGTLIERYPEDVEAKLFLVRFLMKNRKLDADSGGEAPSRKEILRNLLVSHPDHPAVHHYWIHTVEFKNPQAGLESAEKLPELCPNAGHLMHMPGHIYYRMGNYDKARRSFVASFKVDSTYMAQQNIPPARTWNYLHNLNYLVANCAENGRYREGLQWARVLQQVPLNLQRPITFFQGRLPLVRLQIRYGFWESAFESLSELVENDTLATTFASDYCLGLRAYVSGMAAVEKGRLDEAISRSEKLEELNREIAARKKAARGKFYSKRRKNFLSAISLDLQGNIHSIAGEHEQGFEVLEEAIEKKKTLGYSEPPLYSRPVLESLGSAHLRAGDFETARAAYARVMQERPGSGHALLGIARSHAFGGQEVEAGAAYEDFLESWVHADDDLPQVQEAREWLRTHGTGSAP